MEGPEPGELFALQMMELGRPENRDGAPDITRDNT
jgi:hypothetical protein